MKQRFEDFSLRSSLLVAAYLGRYTVSPQVSKVVRLKVICLALL